MYWPKWKFPGRGGVKQKSLHGRGMDIFRNTIYKWINCLSLSQFPPDKMSGRIATPPSELVRFPYHNYFWMYTHFWPQGKVRHCERERTPHSEQAGIGAWRFSPVSSVHWVTCSAQCPHSKTLSFVLLFQDVQPKVHCPRHWQSDHCISHQTNAHIF